MIPESTLERLFAEAAAAVEVPDGGPSAVLAARDASSTEAAEVHRPGLRLRSAPRSLLLAAAIVAVALIGVAVAAGHRGTAPVASGSATAGSAAPASSLSGKGSGATGAPKAATGGVAVGAPAPAAAGGAAAGGATAAGTAGGAVGAVSAVGSADSSGGAGPTVGLSAPASPGGAAPAGPAGPQVPAARTETVKTGTITLVVPAGQVGATIDRLGSAAAGLGGYVQSSSASSGAATPVVPSPGAPPQTLPTTAHPPSSGTLTLRVPVASFEALVTAVTRAGTATSVQTSGQDVTGQYVDLQARIGSLSSERTAYQQILAKATSIGDVLSVEGQLTAVQTQIEQLQGQLAVLADQAGNSTLTVQVDEPSVIAAAAPPPHRSGISKAWAHARASFASGLESLLAASGGVAVALVVGLVAAVAGRFAWRAARRRML